MDPIKLGSGDNDIDATITLNYADQQNSGEAGETSPNPEKQQEDTDRKMDQNELTAQMIDDNEAKLKDRIAHCRNIIESLKIELNEEKIKLEKQNKPTQVRSFETPVKCTTSQSVSTSNIFSENQSYMSGPYRDSVDSKLDCDENLIEYEKQLQKYQNTLNMAQIEKKNAIRKQMLAKAYKLKLLEVENQCNIELLRVKQSLQCLEPLKMIVTKWKTHTDEDDNSYELIPRYPELNAISNYDFNICGDPLDIKSPGDCVDVHNDTCLQIKPDK